MTSQESNLNDLSVQGERGIRRLFSKKETQKIIRGKCLEPNHWGSTIHSHDAITFFWLERLSIAITLSHHHLYYFDI